MFMYQVSKLPNKDLTRYTPHQIDTFCHCSCTYAFKWFNKATTWAEGVDMYILYLIRGASVSPITPWYHQLMGGGNKILYGWLIMSYEAFHWMWLSGSYYQPAGGINQPEYKADYWHHYYQQKTGSIHNTLLPLMCWHLRTPVY